MKIIFFGKEKIPARAVSIVIKEGKDEKNVFVALTAEGGKEIHLGIGERKDMTGRKLVLLARQIIAVAKSHRIGAISIRFADFAFSHLKLRDEAVAELLAVNFEMANFESVDYKTPPEEGWSFVNEVMVTGNGTAPMKKALAKGQVVGEEVNACRKLANMPGGEMTPSLLAKAARDAAKGTAVKVVALGRKEMEKLNMGGILGVAKGSPEEPKFIVMEYMGGKKEKPIALVGKGVTFDTGGLNVKPGESMYEMHMDMSGGAAVIHSLALAAKLKLKKNVVGIIPAVENMPSGSSYRPGDVLRSMSGKTIEVLNTDAEGRIILADALTYAKRYEPRIMLDAATLTGAALVAVGKRTNAFFTRDERLEKLVRELGEESGDYMWPLPLWDEYMEDIKGTFGDIANTGKDRYGGAITAAMFLHEFAKDLPFVHIDIAPRMVAIEGEYLAKGAVGSPVRFFEKFIERY
ncbi:MAG: leucyl aminopeptidase [Candidatus Wildermuthbacteria bacterium]|nr:leucyl aminopeptidase [Candidatus Wildermuthbacteria bacterium]